MSRGAARIAAAGFGTLPVAGRRRGAVAWCGTVVCGAGWARDRGAR